MRFDSVGPDGRPTGPGWVEAVTDCLHDAISALRPWSGAGTREPTARSRLPSPVWVVVGVSSFRGPGEKLYNRL